MGRTWEALRFSFSNRIKDALKDSLVVDISSCIDFGFWAWDFIPRHGSWIGLGVGCVCCYWISLWRWSPYWALFPFRWTWYFVMCLHITLAPLYGVSAKRITEDNVDTGKRKAKTRLPRPRYRRMPSGKYGMVQPVIGESAGPI
jgi:hypothetical protein